MSDCSFKECVRKDETLSATQKLNIVCQLVDDELFMLVLLIGLTDAISLTVGLLQVQ